MCAWLPSLFPHPSLLFVTSTLWAEEGRRERKEVQGRFDLAGTMHWHITSGQSSVKTSCGHSVFPFHLLASLNAAPQLRQGPRCHQLFSASESISWHLVLSATEVMPSGRGPPDIIPLKIAAGQLFPLHLHSISGFKDSSSFGYLSVGAQSVPPSNPLLAGLFRKPPSFLQKLNISLLCPLSFMGEVSN